MSEDSSTRKPGSRALAPLVDPLWSAQKLAGRSTPTAIANLLLNGSADDFRSAVNPLIDLRFIADAYLDGGEQLSALDVLVRYACDLMPRGLSPHPLIHRRVFEFCQQRRTAERFAVDRATWVKLMLKEKDRSGQAVIPFLDPAFVLQQARINAADLVRLGASSVSRFYLGEGARKGLLPHPLFDPVFVHSQRTGRLPSSSELVDPGGFLVTEFAAYLGQAARQGRASPSLGFDEAFTRGNRTIAKAIREHRYANAFHAYVAHTAQMDSLAVTPTGIHSFREAITPKVWWRLDDALPRHRRRVSNSNAVFLAAAIRRLSRERHLPVRVRVDGDLPRTITLGQRLALVVHGFAISPLSRLRKVDIRVGRKSASGSFQGFPRPDIGANAGTLFPTAERMLCGFAVAWCGTARSLGPLKVSVRFKTGGRTAVKTTRWFEAGTIAVERPAIRIYAGKPPQVSIAMATYNPKPNLLRAQIESIRRQSVTDWQLIISDESSAPGALDEIQAIVASDPRIRVMHGEHLGFVGNFERALGQLDRRSPFFALSDQDDVWYPQKLERLIEAIEAKGTALVYGGMRITSEQGRVIDESFFSWRQRHGDTTQELLLANTVTGAACLGRMSLMRHILPIPRYKSAYHDMWIALIASHLGGVSHVSTPLQDYVQHGGNVLGQNSRADRRAAELFRRYRRAIEYERNVGGPISVRQSSRHLNMMSLLSMHWREAIQREFLNIALIYRTTEQTAPDPFSVDALARSAMNRVGVVECNASRAFLNLPGWLEAGARYMRDGKHRSPLLLP